VSYQSNDRSREDLGQSNRRRVISEILFNGPVPRTEIAERTGLTAASVSRITRDLINAGLVAEGKEPLPSNRSGRRSVELSLNPRGGYVLGIGINAFAQVVSLADLNNNLIAERSLEIECLVDPQPVLAAIAEAARVMIVESGIDAGRVLGAGVAMAGAVDPARGILLDSQTLGWKDLDVGPQLERMLDLPVALENLPNSINLAETRFGIAKGCQNVVVVNASLRLGGSLLLDNHIRRGRDFSAALIGDLRVSESGTVSSADDLKTLDELAGGRAVMRTLGLDPEKPGLSSKAVAQLLVDVVARAGRGETGINSGFLHAGQILGRMIDVIWRLLRPETVILAGPLAGVDAYSVGVRKSCLESDSNLPLRISAMSSQEAARLLALNEFIATRSLPLDALAV